METTQTNGKFDNLKSNAAHMLNSGRESFKEAEKITLDTLEEVSGQLSKTVKRTQSFVRENPGLSLAAVLVAGFVIAKMVSHQKQNANKTY